MDGKLESSAFKRGIPAAIHYVLSDVNVCHFVSVLCKLCNYWRCKRRLFSNLRLQVDFTLEQPQPNSRVVVGKCHSSKSK